MKAFLWLIFSLTCFSPGVRANQDDAAEDLAKGLAQYQKQAEQVLKQVDKLGQVAPTQAPVDLDRAKKIAQRLANDDRFLDAAKKIWNHENRNKMLMIQAGFFLFMLIFKAWRQSRSTNWFRKLLIGFSCSIFTWVGLVYVIPLLVLGEPFGIFTGTLWRVLVMGGS